VRGCYRPHSLAKLVKRAGSDCDVCTWRSSTIRAVLLTTSPR
jgi:hypothetical protein